MPPDTVFVTSHIHTDGPIPGPHSLLTLASAAQSGDGARLGTFQANVRELPGASLHPIALQTWRERAEDWLTTRRASRPPALAMTAYTRWIDQLPGPSTYVADLVQPDYPFLYWYLQRFTGQWPFAHTSTEAELNDRFSRTPVCTLSCCQARLVETR